MTPGSAWPAILLLAAAAASTLAQEVAVPPRDALLLAARRPGAPAGTSFLKDRHPVSVPGVAAGGVGARVAGDVGVGGRLRARAATRWLDGVLDMSTDEVGRMRRAGLGRCCGRAAPASRELPPSCFPQVAEFDPTAAPDGDPLDAEDRERDEEEEGDEVGADAAATLPGGGLSLAARPPVAGLDVRLGEGALATPRGQRRPDGRAKPAAKKPAAGAPSPAPFPALLADVDGLNCSDNGVVNGKLTEPPDLALCAGGGFLLQAVNSAWAVYDAATGDLLAGPFSLYSLFKVPKTASMTDPGCVFDAGAVEAGGGGNDGGKPAGGGRSPPTPPPGRFFVTVQWYSRAEGLSHQAIVVSKGPDPRDGFRGVYYVDTSGAAPALNLPNCASQGGCLGDYPSYGLDAHALWVGVNHYTFKTSRLQGAALYGVRKLDLLNETGPAYPAVVAFTEWGGDGARLGFTLQPATPAAGTPPDGRRGGTQYVLASSYFFRTNLSSIVAWAVTNTSLIGAGLPGGAVPSLTPAAVLPALPLRKPARMFKGGLKQVASEQRLDEKDERLQQVVLVRADTPIAGASGAAPSSQPSSYHLWTNMQTAVNVKGGWVSGIAYFRVDPEWRESNAAGASKPAAGAPPRSSSSAWAPVLARNGYVAVPGHHAVNGAVAASPLGAAMALSLLGPGLNYSAAFVRLAPEPVGAVLVPRPAPEPLHGFAAETRNGDFTGACAALDGTLWLAAQCASGTVHVTASGKRQNWATQMVRVDPRGMG